MFAQTIQARVMKVVKERIGQAQKKFDENVKVLSQEFEEKKERMADECVNDVIGKLV